MNSPGEAIFEWWHDWKVDQKLSKLPLAGLGSAKLTNVELNPEKELLFVRNYLIINVLVHFGK